MDPQIISDLIKVVGPSWVLTAEADLLLYSYDSGLDRGMAGAVVLPKTADQVARIVGILSRQNISYVARGAGTSLCGGPVPLQNSVVISLTRMRKIGKVDEKSRDVFAEPGVVNLKLQQALLPWGLHFPPDPGSQKACTIGGNIATNAGGPHCLKYGVTSNWVLALDVVMPGGTPTRVTVNDPGYDLVDLFVGSEGTLGIVTSSKLKLLPIPKFVRTSLVSFPSIEDAIQAVTDIVAAKIIPATLEAMDNTIVRSVESFIHAGYPVDAEAVLLIEVDGNDLSGLEADMEKIKSICEKNKSSEFRFAGSEGEREKLWEGRRGAYPSMARLSPNVLVEDGTVPRTRLPEALKRVKEIAQEYGLKVGLLFHAGDGNLHPQIICDERDVEKTRLVREAGHKMLKVCVELGGTISGEHGIGIDKKDAMKWQFNRETLSLFRRLKNVFDPGNLCNPDKKIPLVGKTQNAGKVQPITGELNPLGFETPEDETRLIELVTHAAKYRRQIGIQGSKSKFRVKENFTIITTRLDKIVDFDRGNLTVTVQGGALVDNVRKSVEAEGLFLGVAGGGTIGGTIATKSSVAPPLRDLILGMKVLLPTGEIVNFGGKTMKNVAGYDGAKLLIGSWGTLGIILEVTFRLQPFPCRELNSERQKPFVFKEIHRQIKKAFDPGEILSQRMTILTDDDIKIIWAANESAMKKGLDIQKRGDKFWVD